MNWAGSTICGYSTSVVHQLAMLGRLVQFQLPAQKRKVMKTIKFFKQDSRWYADIPNHTLEENEMVLGADVLLEKISKGKDELTLEVEVENEPKQYLGHFSRFSHDDNGATYYITGYILNEILDTLTDEEMGLVGAFRMWLCNVTHDVFGEHPIDIWVLKIE